MNLDKPDAQEALKKINEGIDDLNTAANVPRETDEVKKLKDTIGVLILCLVVAIVMFAGSMAAHFVRMGEEQSSITNNIELLRKSNVKANEDRMMNSYYRQMVPMLQSELSEAVNANMKIKKQGELELNVVKQQLELEQRINDVCHLRLEAMKDRK